VFVTHQSIPRHMSSAGSAPPRYVSRSRTTRSWLSWLVIVACALLAASNTIDIAQTVQSARWPSVTGEIIASYDRLEMVGVNIGVSRNRPVHLKRLRLTYSYEVDGRKYEGSRVSMLADYVNAPTRRDVEKYATGHQVTVHYDPQAPTTAVVDTSLPWGRCIQTALAAFVLILVWRGFQPTRAEAPRRNHQPTPH